MRTTPFKSTNLSHEQVEFLFILSVGEQVFNITPCDLLVRMYRCLGANGFIHEMMGDLQIHMEVKSWFKSIFEYTISEVRCNFRKPLVTLKSV